MGSHPSQIWRSIIEGGDILVQGLIRRIGDRTTTEIWNHNWLPRDSSMRPITSAHDVVFWVSDLIDASTASWRIELLTNSFLSMDATAILGIHVCTRGIPDFWSWLMKEMGASQFVSHIVCW